MITKTMSIEGLYIVTSTLSTVERWRAAGKPFSSGFVGEGWLTALILIALITTEILIFWMFSKYRLTEKQLNQKLTDLTVANTKLRQQNDELVADNEKLRRENAQYKQEEELRENEVETNAVIDQET
jgi:cell division protein FtsB